MRILESNHMRAELSVGLKVNKKPFILRRRPTFCLNKKKKVYSKETDKQLVKRKKLCREPVQTSRVTSDEKEDGTRRPSYPEELMLLSLVQRQRQRNHPHLVPKLQGFLALH